MIYLTLIVCKNISYFFLNSFWEINLIQLLNIFVQWQIELLHSVQNIFKNNILYIVS